jgi:hypothetical protein
MARDRPFIGPKLPVARKWTETARPIKEIRAAGRGQRPEGGSPIENCVPSAI